MDLDVDLPLGIFSERLPLHSGFELDAFQYKRGIAPPPKLLGSC